MKKRKIRSVLTVWAMIISMFSTMVVPVAAQAEESTIEQIDPADIIPGEVVVR